MNTFKFKLITPQGSYYDNPAVSVSAPGAEGRFEVLAGHENIIAILTRGILKIKGENSEAYFAILTGVLEVDGNRDVIVLADQALKADTQTEAQQKVLELEAA